MFWKAKYNIESKKEFRLKVEKHFQNLADEKVSNKIVIGLSEYLANLLYESYKGFRKQYPKSRKQYSKLNIEDLNNPFYMYIIYDFIKREMSFDYKWIARQFLDLSEAEFIEFEKRKNQFENM